jgi:carboxymethylenebutenolidase
MSPTLRDEAIMRCFGVSVILFAVCLSPLRGGPRKAEPLEVSYRSGKETIRAWCYAPEGKGHHPGIIVVHGDFGPTDWVKEQGSRLAGKGYIALVIDLYRGERPKDVEEAHILERGLEEDRVAADMRAAVEFLSSRPEVRKEALGIIGWDMGGGHALDAAIRDRRLRATVVCYGRVPTEAATLSTLQGSVLGIFAGKDEGLPAATLDRFRAAMTKTGKKLAGMHVYRECGNGFMDPDSPYKTGPADSTAIRDAWSRIDDYFAKELKGSGDKR